MDLRQFKYFLRIAELGSLSRAADSLHVAQSALSRHVSNLEHEFGQALFLRTGRGVSLTPAGVELARYASAMLRLGAEARAALASTADSPSGTVAVGFPLSLTAELCLPLIEGCRTRHPRLALQIHDEISGALADRLRAGRLQVAIVFEDSRLDGLSWQPVFEEELYLAVSSAHPLAQAASVALAQLAAVPLALPSAGLGVRPIVDEVLRRAGFEPDVFVEANSLSVMRQVVRRGLGGAVLSSSSIVEDVAAGDVVALPVSDGRMSRRAVVALAPVEPRLQATAVVFELLVELARARAASGRWPGCRALGG